MAAPTKQLQPKEHFEWRVVTPETAFDLLEKTNKKNRVVSDATVQKYADDMKAGLWRRTTTPIKFDWDGVLIDGQHRLWAVVESKVPVEFYFALNCNPDEREVQDIGKNRNLRDILHFANKTVSTVVTGVVTRMILGTQASGVLTIPAKQEFYLQHQEAIDWAVKFKTSRRGSAANSAALAVLARAYYTADRDKLTRFGAILTSGECFDQSELAAVTFREHALRSTRGGAAVRYEMYLKCERALVAFRGRAFGESLRRLEEQFLLPEEEKARKISVRSQVGRQKKRKAEVTSVASREVAASKRAIKKKQQELNADGGLKGMKKARVKGEGVGPSPSDQEDIRKALRRIQVKHTVRRALLDSEDEEQATVIAWARLHEGKYPGLDLLYAIPNGGLRSKRTAARLQRTGLKPGVPDLCLPVPRPARFYHGLYIEMKRRSGGRITPEQASWIDRLSKQGYCCAVCKGADAAIDELVYYLSD